MNETAAKSWWGRNWFWVLPVGCLTPVVACGGCFALLFMLVFGALKSSEVYVESLDLAKANDDVKALLGEPIAAGALVSGNIEIQDGSGKADLSIPISGPKGSATIYAVATKSGGKWEYSRLEVVSDDSTTRIDLRAERNR